MKVTTVDGLVDLKIPGGTQPGTTLVMSKRGVPRLGVANSRGDHQVGNACLSMHSSKCSICKHATWPLHTRGYPAVGGAHVCFVPQIRASKCVTVLNSQDNCCQS